MDDTRGSSAQGADEGEGSRTADERYRKPATAFAGRTPTWQEGLGAEREVENYRDEYDQAEKAGRSHDAADLQGKNHQHR